MDRAVVEELVKAAKMSYILLYPHTVASMTGVSFLERLEAAITAAECELSKDQPEGIA
jgi:predicted oxidoreductase